MYRINHYPLDSALGFAMTYPLGHIGLFLRIISFLVLLVPSSIRTTGFAE